MHFFACVMCAVLKLLFDQIHFPSHQPLQKFNSESRSILTEVEIFFNVHKIIFGGYGGPRQLLQKKSEGFPYLFQAFNCQIANLCMAK